MKKYLIILLVITSQNLFARMFTLADLHKLASSTEYRYFLFKRSVNGNTKYSIVDKVTGYNMDVVLGAIDGNNNVSKINSLKNQSWDNEKNIVISTKMPIEKFVSNSVKGVDYNKPYNEYLRNRMKTYENIFEKIDEQFSTKAQQDAADRVAYSVNTSSDSIKRHREARESEVREIPSRYKSESNNDKYMDQIDSLRTQIKILSDELNRLEKEIKRNK